VPDNSDESVLARCDSYGNINRVLIALLAFEGVNVTRSLDQAEPDSFRKKILEKFDNEYSMFHQCLGLRVNQHLVRFRKQNEDPPHNTARAAIEHLRLYSEWYRSPTRSRPWRPQLHGVRVEYPFDVYDLSKWYTPVLHALVGALSICMECARTFSVVTEENSASTTGPIKCMHVPSTTSSELDSSILDSDISGPQYTEQWGCAQSPPESTSAATHSPSPKSIEHESTKEALGQMKVNSLQSKTLGASVKDVVQAKAGDFTTSFLASHPAPTNLTAMKQFVANPMISQPTRVILAATSRSLQQELANERISREVENRGHIAQVTKMNCELTEAQENFHVLLQELDAAKANKVELQIALKDVAKAKEDAEWDRYITRNKLELTLENNASLKKEVEKAREKGRDDIRAQVSGALRTILSPSLQ